LLSVSGGLLRIGSNRSAQLTQFFWSFTCCLRRTDDISLIGQTLECGTRRYRILIDCIELS